MKIKVLVVDDNEGLVNLVCKYFSSSDNIEVIGTCKNGEEAIKVLNNPDIKFDLMLLDLVMPNKDGVAVLEYMKFHSIKKKVIVMTSYSEEQTIRDISEYGVRYYCLKPFNFDDLRDKIVQTFEIKKKNESILELDNRDIQIQVTKLLHALGIPSHIKGYQFIRSAILMVYENPGFIGGITKELYPDLSIKFNTSIPRVERAIRHAIDVSWNKGKFDNINKIVGMKLYTKLDKPSNGELIALVANKLLTEGI